METHVREQIADRDLEAWLVVDTSAAMRFGTTVADKSQAALVAAASRRVPHRPQPEPARCRARRRAAPQGDAATSRAATRSAPCWRSRRRRRRPRAAGRATSAARSIAWPAISKRRGFVAVISDFGGDAWIDPLARLGMRHDLLAITVLDPRELDVPPVGMIEVVDPSTGRRREVRVTAAVQRRYAAAAAEAVETPPLRDPPRRRRPHRAGDRRRLAGRDRRPRHPPAHAGRQRQVLRRELGDR